MRFYSDPTRADDRWSLSDCEVFYVGATEIQDEDGEYLDPGWYYWFCFPGCMPEGPPMGPYATAAAAVADCQKENADV